MKKTMSSPTDFFTSEKGSGSYFRKISPSQEAHLCLSAIKCALESRGEENCVKKAYSAPLEASLAEGPTARGEAFLVATNESLPLGAGDVQPGSRSGA